jgi:hypothetical protein
MTQLIKHYWVDRNRTGVFAISPEQFAQPMFGVVGFQAEGLVGVHKLTDENGIEFFLSTVPDETVIDEVPGLYILTQQEWDGEITAYDTRQEAKRQNSVRRYRNQLLTETDWIVTRSTETSVALSQEFTDWRQELRDLPTVEPFPTEIPAAPTGVTIDETVYDSYLAELRGTHMVNDPLPPLEQPQEGLV